MLSRFSCKQPRAIQVDINHLPPSLILVVLRFDIIHNTSRCDKAVNLAKVSDDVCPSAFDARFRRYVAGVRLKGGDRITGSCSAEVRGYVSDGVAASREGEVNAGAVGALAHILGKILIRGLYPLAPDKAKPVRNSLPSPRAALGIPSVSQSGRGSQGLRTRLLDCFTSADAHFFIATKGLFSPTHVFPSNENTGSVLTPRF